MDVDVRRPDPDQLHTFRHLLGLAFGFDPDPDEEERFLELIEAERTRCAFDGDEMVGTATAFSLDLTVPGGTVPCAGTTMVTTKPTHRRRGILRALMAAHFDEVVERGEPVAALWASDSAIYGRFGFGQASEGVEVTVARSEDPLHRLAPEPSPVELVDVDTARKVFPEVFEQVRVRRPGCYARSAVWWEHRHFHDPRQRRDGGTSQRLCVTRSNGGEPTGYVRYRVEAKWEEHHGAGVLTVLELQATTPEAAAGLWRFLLTHDLIAKVVAHDRPVDDPLFELLAAPRRARRVTTDALWLRVLDVPAALEARRYRGPASFVFDVSDPTGRSGGTFRLEIDEAGHARCRPSRGPVDLRLDIEDLGSAYLGAPRFARSLRAGRLDGDPATAVRADIAFTWDPPPWCPEVF